MLYRFGGFELDAARFELRHGGVRAEVQPKALRLLLHLVEHRDRVVSADELLRALWPDEVVSHGSIKRAVLGARQALGAFDAAQAWIRTVPRFGYQFAGDIVVDRAADGGGAAHEPERPASMPTRQAFLGRERVMDVLEESLQHALAGTCRCVLLVGGPGIGKTRTVEAVLERARALGADAWTGRCTEVEGAPGFWPFIQVFREARRERGAERLRALLGDEAADVAAAMGELQGLPTLPEVEPSTGAVARFRLFDGMAVFLRRAAEERPIVLALDDLHRADPASLRLLIFVLRQVRRAPLMVVGAFRPEGLDAPETAQLLEELTHEAGARCVTMEGLTRTDVARYLALTLDEPAPAAVSEALHAQTAGNPLFVHHLVEAFRASAEHARPLAWERLTSSPVSRGLAGAIEQHLRLVSGACRALLRVAAVLGTSFSAGVLARVAELSSSACSARLTEALASGLIVEVPCELGAYRFAHVLVRDALYAQLSATERGGLHWSAARALEAHGVGDSAPLLAEVTRHYLQAAPTHDAERALAYTLRAAELALHSLAYEQAAADFDRALALLQYADPDPRRRMELLFRKGDALARIELAGARKALFEAAALARELGDCDMLVRAATLIASRPETGSVDAAQVEVLRQALASLRERSAPDGSCILLEALIAKSLLYAAEPRERVSLALATLRRTDTVDDAAQRAAALRSCHEALPGPNHLHERVRIATELMSLAHRSGDPAALLRAFAVHIETSVERGDMQAVDTGLAGMDVLAERVREPFYRWYGKVVRAMRDYVRGALERSHQGLHEAWRSSASISPELARHMYVVQLHAVLCMRGELAAAEPFAREMMLRYPALVGWSAAWGALVAVLDRRDEARRCFDRLMSQGAASHCEASTVLAGLAALSELCCKLGDVAAARVIYDVLRPYGAQHGLTSLGAGTYGAMSRQLGALAECRGDLESATAHYREALRSAEQMHSPVFVSSTSVQYARALLRGGDPQRRAQAAALLARATQLARQSQLTSVAVVCDRLAARHGVPRLAACAASDGEPAALALQRRGPLR